MSQVKGGTSHIIMATLSAFSDEQARRVKILLATQVSSMMGRKLEEGDWTKVYCRAKGIPEAGWSNLHIDVNHGGLGLEIKLLRIAQLKGKPLKTVCGTTLMHPAATRSIRIESTEAPATQVVSEVFSQYGELVQFRTRRVQETTPDVPPDMRTGWLIWEDSLTEFLYFEEPMIAPNPAEYYGEWNTTPARGARKSSKSLWVYDRQTNQKRYSVTTSAGIKIQPYFDIPAPSDSNLYYFRVQSEPVDSETICLWVAGVTARALERRLGSLDREAVSAAIMRLLSGQQVAPERVPVDEDLAVPIPLSKEAYGHLLIAWEAVNDEHRAQLLLRSLE